MATTGEDVWGNHVEMSGTCDHCGAAWFATGSKQPGCNDSEPIYCPKCRQPAGGTMHCAFGPSVELVRTRRRKAG